jgi:large subunit ribosomal protein L20
MARAVSGVVSRKRRKKVLKAASGAYQGRHRLFKSAKETVQKGLQYAYADRKRKKREYRQMWIARINAACRLNGISYSRLINGLTMAGVTVDRKMLSEIAINDPEAFTAIVDRARTALENNSPDPKSAVRKVPAI